MDKIKIKNKPTIFKNSDFQTIIIKVLFPFKEKIEDLANIALLPSMLNYMNEFYPTEEEFASSKKDLYILNTICFSKVIGEDGFFSFHLIIPDTSVLDDNSLDKQLLFFKHFIYSPLIKDGGFIEFELEREKKNLKLGLENSLKNLRPYQGYKIKKLIDDQGILSRSLIDNIELIDQVTTKSLYQYYLDVIKNNQPLIYVFGNISDNSINEKIKNYLLLKDYKNKTININSMYFLKPRSEVLEITEESKFKDSSLSIVYKIKNMKKEDMIYLKLVQELLSSLSSRLLDKKLRTLNDLIYSSKVLAYTNYGVLELTAYIKKDDVEKTKKVLFEVIEEFHNIDEMQPLLDNIVEKRRIGLLRELDNKNMLFDDLIIDDLKYDYTSLEYYEIIKNIKASDISLFVDRFVLDTIYFLKEVDDDENR